jgi:hypothetical protein
MKVYEDKYPFGTLKNQKTAGIYAHELLHDNLKELAKAIVRDNSFLFLVSSQALSVRTGKSTFTQNMAEDWNFIMREEHKINLDFDMRNIAFNADEFEKKAFALFERGQKYGVVILDESDDLTGHSLSQEVKKIKRFLRKAGQLNLLMIMILPDFFEFPKSIAVNRSVALITVDYGEHFERGHFKFYDFKSKKKLYIKGKAFNDYSVADCTFRGQFTGQYLVNEDEYRAEKYRDLFDDAQKEKDKRLNTLKISIMQKIFKNCVKKLKGQVTRKELTELFEISDTTADNWLKEPKEENPSPTPNQILY